jgi:hypothetical protein
MAILDALYSKAAMTLFIKVYSSIEVAGSTGTQFAASFAVWIATYCAKNATVASFEHPSEIDGPDLKTIRELER